MRFKATEKHQGTHPTNSQCQIIYASKRDYRGYCTELISQSQKTDMVLLANIRDLVTLSHHCYGKFRMTEDLEEFTLQVGHRRVGRTTRQNAI